MIFATETIIIVRNTITCFNQTTFKNLFSYIPSNSQKLLS